MLARRVATILGVFLLIEGVWGMFSPVVFGVLTTNVAHAVIHILLGIAGIVMGRGDMARGYLMSVGGLLLLVGILFFVPIASEIILSILNVNVAVAWVNIIVGVICIAVATQGKEEGTVVI
jgi:uncharacterized membrane protein